MKLTVISQNIRCANDPDGHSIEERAPRIKALMDAYNADLVGFQEIKPVWLEHLNADFGADYEVFCQYRTTTGKPEGPAMMWKKDVFDCLEKGVFWLSDTPEEESQGWDTLGYPRNAVWATLRHKESGKVFTHISTHYGFGDEGQLKSNEVILAQIAKRGTPAFVTADFNFVPESPAYQDMILYLRDVNTATVGDKGNTFHAYHPEGEKARRIDFIFATQDLKPLTYRRLTETYDGKYPSDHYGILTEFEL